LFMWDWPKATQRKHKVGETSRCAGTLAYGGVNLKILRVRFCLQLVPSIVPGRGGWRGVEAEREP